MSPSKINSTAQSVSEAGLGKSCRSSASRSDNLPCDLDNTIHPIFARSNWPAEGFEYEKWTPTLRLASLFLTHSSGLGWWTRAALGSPCDALDSSTTIADDTQEHIQRRDRIRVVGQIRKFWDIAKEEVRPQPKPLYVSEVENSTKNTWRTHKALEELADRITFMHGPIPLYTWGTTRYKRSGKSEIRLCSTFWGYYELSEKERLTIFSSQDRVFLEFTAAIILCHEVAHALYNARAGEFARINWRRSLVEPHICFRDGRHVRSELGYSWEAYTFGGFCDFVDRRVTAWEMRSAWNQGLEMHLFLTLKKTSVLGVESRIVSSEWANA